MWRAGTKEEGRLRRGSRLALLAVVVLALGLASIFLDPRDVGLSGETEFVKARACGTCHAVNHPRWRTTLHATMVREATPLTVVGDFDTHNEYWLRDGTYGAALTDNDRLLVLMRRSGDEFHAYIHDPSTGLMNSYRISHVVGSTYRQVYLVESEGTYFRIPIQWSIAQQRWVNLWNRQQQVDETPATPMSHFLNENGHWNEFCARCHTTGYRSGKEWSELGIACEACHGAGSAHVLYYRDSKRLRLRSAILKALGLAEDSFIVRPTDLDAARSVSVCGQCHQADIWMRSVERFVAYEPGEDLSSHFYEIPLQPEVQEPPSNKTWPDGSPRGAGLLFRSFVESECFRRGGVTCVDCHDPHGGGEYPGLDAPGPASDAFCNRCHASVGAAIEAHAHHRAEGEGARCYGCHMPRMVEGLTMVGDFGYAHVRSHELDHIPYPESSVRFGGAQRMPNSCNDCHGDRSAAWAAEWSVRWWGPREKIAEEIRARFAVEPGAERERTAGL